MSLIAVVAALPGHIDEVVLSEIHSEGHGAGPISVQQAYRVRETIDFTSARKRMSVVVEEQDGDGVVVYMKGDDNISRNFVLICTLYCI